MSPQEVIRAAYVELMRRYHPDRNPSAAAAAQVRAITAAYSVIGVPDRRAKYDFQRTRLRPGRGSVAFEVRRAPLRPTSWLPLLGIPVFLLLVWLLLPPQLVLPDGTAEKPVRAAEAIPAKEMVAPAAKPNDRALCNSPIASGLLKRELFRRAAQVRGSDRAAFERIANFSVIRLGSLFANRSQTTGQVGCDAFVALDLPPGTSADGGLRNLTGNVSYSLYSPDTGHGSGVELIADGSLASVLATVVQTSRGVDIIQASADAHENSPGAPRENSIAASISMNTPPRPALVSREPEATSSVPQRSAPQQHPSFSCRQAKSWAATSVCNSASLAALDRTLARLYGDSIQKVDQSKRGLLDQGDRRFVAKRDGCSTVECIQSVYLARIQEIHALAASR